MKAYFDKFINSKFIISLLLLLTIF